MADKAIFLDRDDTLLEDPGYINHPDQVKLLPGVADALIQLRNMGYKLVVVSNQSGVARGIVTEEVLVQIHQQMDELLVREGARVDRIYYCPYHPEGVVPKYRKESDWRKPNPGMILAAAEEMDIDLSRSWSVGNAYRDVIAGLRAGCKTILINSPVRPIRKKVGDPVPDKEAVNIQEAVNIIKMYDRQAVGSHIIEIEAEIGEIDEIAEIVAEAVPEDEQTAQPIHEQIRNLTMGQKTSEPDHHRQAQAEHTTDAERTETLHEELLRYLKSLRRDNAFDEFSMIKVLVGILQIAVPFCLLLSVWFLMDHTRGVESVHTAIGYAIALQLMAIGLYMMRDRK